MEEYGNEIYKAYRVEGISGAEVNTDKSATIYVCAKKIDSTTPKLRVQQGRWERAWAGKKWILQGNILHFYDLDREIKNQLGGKKEYNPIYEKNILLYGAGYACRLFLKTVSVDTINIIEIADKNVDNINIDGF